MSQLEELIKNHCPNGVIYLELEKVSSFRRGSFPQPYTNPDFYGGDCSMPFVQVADMLDESFVLAETTKQSISKIAQPKSIFVPKGTILVSIQGTLGRVAITQYDAYVDRTIAIFYEIDKRLNQKFFAYVLKQKFDYEKQYARGSTLKTITKEEFSVFKIPVPPLEVQCEIVRILDSFTELTAELTVELTTEFTARKKQYEYYIEKVFDFSDSIKKVKLSDLVTFSQGIQIDVNLQKKEPFEGSVRFLRIVDFVNENEPPRYVQKPADKFIKEDGELIMIRYGASAAGKVFIKHSGAIANNMFKINVISDEVLTKYVFYYLAQKHIYESLNHVSSGSTMPAVTFSMVSDIYIYVPSIEKQKEIINKIETLNNYIFNLENGLPAEINARQKQYEYYRDQLLSFKELSK